MPSKTSQLVEKEIYETKQKEVEAIVNPIMTKLYQNSGAPAQGGFEGASYSTSSEPKVEQVD